MPDDEMLSRAPLDLTLPEGTGPENGLPRSGDASGHSSSPDGDVSGRPPRALRMVEPTYPEDAREHGVRASLELKLTVSEEGHVEQCEVTGRSYRAADGKPAESTEPQGYGLSDAACAAARQWRFRPATENGAPTQAQTQITISFGEP